LIKDSDIKADDEDKLQDLIREYQKEEYAIPVVLKVKKEEDDYTVLEEISHAKAAYMAKTPYVPVEVVKN